VVDYPALYKAVDKTFPHRDNWRYHGCPNDAFHIACTGHIKRINNGLTRFGINHWDRDLLKLRIEMFSLAQSLYLEKQVKALAK
jgi:hypothetical protein